MKQLKFTPNSLKSILYIAISWRVLLLVFVGLSVSLVPLQNNFLGGDRANYLANPYLFSGVNFDGQHYLSIARNGYKNLQYFYFPFYPLLVKFLTPAFYGNLAGFAFAGQLISFASLLLSLIGLKMLIVKDYSRKVFNHTAALLLLFPVSFYLASFYTESLFLALSVWAFVFARRGNWLAASVIVAVSTATRIIGLALIPALLYEFWLQHPNMGKTKIQAILPIAIMPIGIAVYMVHLNEVVGDPLEFFNSVSLFGDQRSTTLILLPQVFYRYIFKILPNLNYSHFPSTFPAVLEFATGAWLLVLSVIGYLKLRKSYWVYLVGAYLLPTLSGSFSSLARYSLVIFPAFILTATYVSKLSRLLQVAIYAILFIGLMVSSMMFYRGFWIA